MQCIECGHVLADNDSFCTGCGKKVEFSKVLIDRAVQGDDEAQTQIYNETYQSAYTQVRSMVRDEDAALDILQDSYVKAFRNLAQLNEANKFRAWFKTITHNRTMDYFRERKSLVFSEAVSADAEEVEMEIVDDYPDRQPEVVMDRQETERLIDEILNDLPEEQRAVISMFYYEQQSVGEIAAELGVSKNTVKSRLNYGRKKVESEVRALEKKGTKLYGLAPIPFLLMLFRRMEAQAAELPAGLWKRIKLRLSTKPAGIEPDGQKFSGAKIREVLEDRLAGLPANVDFSKVIPMLTQPLAIKIIAAVALLLVASVMVRVISGNRNTPAPPSQSVSTQSEDAEDPSPAGEENTEASSESAENKEPLKTAAEREREGRARATEIWGDTAVTEYVLKGVHFYVPSEYALQLHPGYVSGKYFPHWPKYYWDSGEEATEIIVAGAYSPNENWNVIFAVEYLHEKVIYENALAYEDGNSICLTIEVGNANGSASNEVFQGEDIDKFVTRSYAPDNIRQFPWEKVLASAWAGEPDPDGRPSLTEKDLRIGELILDRDLIERFRQREDVTTQNSPNQLMLRFEDGDYVSLSCSYRESEGTLKSIRSAAERKGKSYAIDTWNTWVSIDESETHLSELQQKIEALPEGERDRTYKLQICALEADENGRYAEYLLSFTNMTDREILTHFQTLLTDACGAEAVPDLFALPDTETLRSMIESYEE